MTTPVTSKFTISADELRRKHADDGWAARLEACARDRRVYIESTPGLGQTIQKTLLKYWDEDKNVIAVLIKYRRQDGDRLSVRMLREGDTVYSAPAVSGSAPS